MPGKIQDEVLGQLVAQARSLGFLRVAALPVADVSADFKNFYADYLARGLGAGLKYLSRPERFDLRAVFPGARTLILFTYPYRFPSVETKLKAAPYKIARYAWQRDYHNLLKEKLASVARGAGLTGRAVTDSAPVLERYWARRAGLGLIGKNGMLIDRKYGSYFMIAALLVEQELGINNEAQSDAIPARDFATLCGDCKLCVEACPTQALRGDGLMETAKCISFQTIEAKADTPAGQAGKKHRWIFGCDICQQVCPYNKSDVSFADDRFSDEHPAAQRISAGDIPGVRSLLRDSVFFRRGAAALQKNLRNV